MTSSLFFLGAKRRGRIPRSGVKSSLVVRFAVTPSERDALGEVARENGKTLSDVIREAVDSYVADYSDRTGPFAKAMRRD